MDGSVWFVGGSGGGIEMWRACVTAGGLLPREQGAMRLEMGFGGKEGEVKICS